MNSEPGPSSIREKGNTRAKEEKTRGGTSKGGLGGWWRRPVIQKKSPEQMSKT